MNPAIVQNSNDFGASMGTLDIQALKANQLKTNGTLRHEDYIAWDQKMVDIAHRNLIAISDLMTLGLTRTDFDLGDIVSQFEKISDMTEADVNMDGVTRGQRDRIVFTETGVPIPIFRKDFTLNERQILSSRRRPGGGLPTAGVSAASILVTEKLESMAFDGVPGIVMDGLQVFGYTTHPNRNTKTITNAWGGGSEDPVDDILDMISKARADNFYGPYYLYVSEDNAMFIENDYSTAKGDRTYKERFLAIPSVVAVKVATELQDGELVLVQMTDDVVDLAIAQDMINFEQPQSDRMQHDFTVMSAMAIRVKSDFDGRCGVVHATGA